MTKLPSCGMLLALLCLLMAPKILAEDDPNSVPPERAELRQNVRQLFWDEKFDELDELADRLWREKSRFTDGRWKLEAFYLGFRVVPAKTKVDWEGWWQRYARWQKHSPQSATARVMQAWTLVNYAWEARGSGWANTVTDEGWKLFAERLKQCRDLLESDPALKNIPGYYEVMLTVALGQGWDKAEAKRLFADAKRLAPDYEPFYFKRAYFLQPKWYGEPGEWLAFAAESADATAKDLGQSMYARIVWSVMGTQRVLKWEDENIDWPRMRRGFEDLNERWPDSWWNKNAFCLYACKAQDRETAQRLFSELRGHVTPGIWGGKKVFAQYKQWADGPLAAPKVEKE